VCFGRTQRACARSHALMRAPAFWRWLRRVLSQVCNKIHQAEELCQRAMRLSEHGDKRQQVEARFEFASFHHRCRGSLFLLGTISCQPVRLPSARRLICIENIICNVPASSRTLPSTAHARAPRARATPSLSPSPVRSRPLSQPFLVCVCVFAGVPA